MSLNKSCVDTMGFRNLFGKKDRANAPEERVVTMEELLPWVRGEAEKAAADLMSKGEAHGREIDRLFENISDIVAELDGKELGEELIKRLETITITSKKAYCSAMSALLSKRQRYESGDPEGVKAFYTGVQETLVQINKTATSKGRYLAIAYEHEVKEMGRTLKQIAVEANSLSMIYDEIAPRWEAAKAIEALVEEHASLDEGALAELTDQAKASVDHCLGVAARAKKELSAYQASERARGHLGDKALLDTLEKEEHEQNLGLYEYLAPVRRMFKKFKNAADRGVVTMPSPEYSLMEQMIEYPVIAVTAEGGLQRCKSLMALVRTGLESSIITEKQTRIDKAVSRCKEIERGDMDMMVDGYVELIGRRKTLAQALESYHDPELESLERQLRDAESGVAAARNALRDQQARMEAATQRREHIKAEIKRLISEFYEEITLNF